MNTNSNIPQSDWAILKQQDLQLPYDHEGPCTNKIRYNHTFLNTFVVGLLKLLPGK